jgi:hypothetical protein
VIARRDDAIAFPDYAIAFPDGANAIRPYHDARCDDAIAVCDGDNTIIPIATAIYWRTTLIVARLFSCSKTTK